MQDIAVKSCGYKFDTHFPLTHLLSQVLLLVAGDFPRDYDGRVSHDYDERVSRDYDERSAHPLPTSYPPQQVVSFPTVVSAPGYDGLPLAASITPLPMPVSGFNPHMSVGPRPTPPMVPGVMLIQPGMAPPLGYRPTPPVMGGPIQTLISSTVVTPGIPPQPSTTETNTSSKQALIGTSDKDSNLVSVPIKSGNTYIQSQIQPQNDNLVQVPINAKTLVSQSKKRDNCGNLVDVIQKQNLLSIAPQLVAMPKKITYMYISPLHCKCLVPACKGKVFASSDKLLRHWKRVHSYICWQCNIRVSSKDKLREHFISVHRFTVAQADNYVQGVVLKDSADKKYSARFIDPGNMRIDVNGDKVPVSELYAEVQLDIGVATTQADETIMEVRSGGSSDKEDMDDEKESGEIDNSQEQIESDPTIEVNPKTCKCPVPECKEKTFKTAEGFQKHWVSFHEMKIEYKWLLYCYICGQKSFGKHRLMDHCRSFHKMAIGKARKHIDQARRQQISVNVNTSYINPLIYKMGKLKNDPYKLPKADIKLKLSTKDCSVIGNRSEEIVTLYQCPVPICGGDVFDSKDRLHNHWREYHERHIITVYICTVCACHFTGLHKLKSHIEDLHCYSGDDLEYYLELSQTFQQRDTKKSDFIDPGEKKLPGLKHPKSEQVIKKCDFEFIDGGKCLRCPVHDCNRQMFETQALFMEHWQMLHEKQYISKYSCSNCPFYSDSRGQLANHYKTIHDFAGLTFEYFLRHSQMCKVRTISVFVDPGKFRLKDHTRNSDESKEINGDMFQDGPKVELVKPGINECPVEECKAKLISNSDLVQHWTTYHIPYNTYCLCPNWEKDCRFVSQSLSLLKLHFDREHKQPSEHSYPFTLNNPDKWKVYNQLYIDPGKYKLGKNDIKIEKKESPHAKLQYVSEDCVKCPTVSCKGKPAYKNYEDLCGHWEKYHVPLYQFYRCRYWECSVVCDSLQDVKQHLQLKHGYSGAKLHSTLTAIILDEYRNTSFINPGPYRLKRRNAQKGFITAEPKSMKKQEPVKGMSDAEVVTYEDLLRMFWQNWEPQPTMIMIRGLPGVGKTRLSRYMKVAVKGLC